MIPLDDILIYNQDLNQGHIMAIQEMLDILKIYSLYIDLKKC